MRLSRVRPLSLIGIFWLECGSLFSQSVVKPWSAPSKIEPGLELAVSWKWWVAPSATQQWGMPLPEALRPKAPSSSALDPTTPGGIRPENYEVKKGDAIIKIAKKFDMTLWQLMHFNDLKDDRIKIGQILRIPTPGQVLTMVPPPPPPPPPEPKKKAPKAVLTPEPPPDLDPGGEIQRELDNVLLQVFLDREMFSPGMIDGKSGATFLKICEIYQRSHPDAADSARLKAKAETTLKEPYARYILRADDFKFITPPKDVPAVARGKGAPSHGKKTSKPEPAAPAPVITIDERVAADFLAYTSTWEFVAERFHCDEAFLRRINPSLKGTPTVGAEFQVPNVIPFEIETALDAPLQPPADPQKPVTAAVVLLSRLEISRAGKLIAVLPLSTARPGLRGRDKWTVLAAIPQPRMATKREPREIPKPPPASAGAGLPSATPEIPAPLEKAQYLAPGPNNPVGIIWINLAKAGSSDPLPYGLHGTSSPAQMKLPGLGGLRLTNWDIARATRLMPAGTVLQWKAQ